MKNLITQEAYDAALARGREALEKPHATEAKFLGRTSTLLIQFSNGIGYAIDVRQAPHLKEFPLSKLKAPYVTAGGDSLIFEDADLAVHLPHLIAHFVSLEVARSRVAAEQGRGGDQQAPRQGRTRPALPMART